MMTDSLGSIDRHSNYRQWRNAVSAIAAAWMLGSCTIADGYGPRALAYNAESGDARVKVSLLNVVRSAYRVPLSFTDVSTVTGTASASGSLSSVVPFLADGGTISPSAALSGGPSFTVPSLNTKEFYSGIFTPISVETVGNLLDQGVRPEVLIPLVIAEFSISEGSSLRGIKFDLNTAEQFKSNYAFAYKLVLEGLSVAKPRKDTQIGPNLNASQAKELLGSIVQASADARSGNKVPTMSVKSGTNLYALNGASTGYQFCFDPARSETRKRMLYKNSNLYEAKLNTRPTIDLAIGGGQKLRDFQLPRNLDCQSNELGKGEDKIKVQIKLRSLAGIYNYLGSIARLQLGLNDGNPRDVSYFGSNPNTSYYLFNLRRGYPDYLSTSVNFAGDNYYVTADPSAGADASTQVLQVLNILQALNSSASNLPSPAIAILQR